MKKPKLPSVPAETADTVRHAIFSLLLGKQRSARDLSFEVRIPEKDAYDHLEHIRRSAPAAGYRLEVTPAECRKCGFLFTKRERLKKPGKCPVCRGEAIHEPLLELRGNR